MLTSALTCGLVLAGAVVVGETTVRAPRDSADVVDAAVLVDVDAVVDPAGTLLAAPGVSLARDGGPLSSVRPMVRGLGGARLVVDVDGVPFVDPAAGAVDAALLPLGLGRVQVDAGAGAGVGGGLSLRASNHSQLQLNVGDLSTLVARGRGYFHHDSGTATVVVQGGTTRGDFHFTATDALGGTGPVLVRANNDQRRFNLATIVDGHGPAPSPLGGQLHSTLVGVLALHDGGVAGFATAPFVDLRASTMQGVVGGEIAHVDNGLRVRVFGDVGGSDRRTWRTSSTAPADILAAISRHGGFGLRTDVWRDDHLRLVVDTNVQGTFSTVAGVVDRTDFAVDGSIGGDFDVGVGHLLVSIAGTMRTVIDVGDGNERQQLALPAGRARLGLARNIGDSTRATVFVGVAHSSRAPTLDERFAPRGFVNGSADLRPERGSDVEVGGSVAVDHVVVSATGFASQLDDTIVYVNKNAFEVAPDNTGAARRVGLDLGGHWSPFEYVRIDVTTSLLSSFVTATAAPLPTAPPYALRTALHLGDQRGFFEAVVVGRGAAPTTIFGTLPSPAYGLLNLMVRVPLNDALALIATVDNALDVTSARDSNLLPLPGRLVFVGLEVRP